MKTLSLLFVATLAVGCHPQAVEYSGQVTVKSTELVPINPDVKVVADAEKPMFFAAGSYWMFHDAAWYRADSIRGRFVLERNPPVPVIQIDQPYAFTRYRLDHPAEQTAAVPEPVSAQAAERSAEPAPAQKDYNFEQNPLLSFEKQ